MKLKIVLLPLDERPCNAAFASKLFGGPDVTIKTPEFMGWKKEAADPEKIFSFLYKECQDADGLILSIDMLLYGGLIPSRIHFLDFETIQRRLDWVRQLKNTFPQMTIYAFQCIMRCPAYSSSEEEPDYYGRYGKEIHSSGNKKHQYMLGLCEEEEVKKAIEAIAPTVLNDYLNRRALNLEFNKKALELVRDGVLDFFVVPQDDSAKYGYTALDQQEIRNKINEMNLQTKVLMYPGADEVALTLMSRMLLKFHRRYPSVYLMYAAHAAHDIIPAYEDRTLGETVKCQIMAAGCRLIDTVAEADFVLAIDCPAGEMKEAFQQPVRNADYCTERNLTEFVLFIADCIRAGKPVTICDNAYANGGDLELIDLLEYMGLLDKLSGYAGWNTSSNTMGTAIAEGVCCYLFGETTKLKSFLALRYLEDVGYCSVVRWHINENTLKAMGMDYFDVHEEQGVISYEVHRQLEQFAKQKLTSICEHINLQDVRMPWRRMFETDLTVHWIP